VAWVNGLPWPVPIRYGFLVFSLRCSVRTSDSTIDPVVMPRLDLGKRRSERSTAQEHAMSMEQLENEAMKLPPEERERLGVKLLSSVDRGLDFEAEWAEEVDRRIQGLEDGSAKSIPGDDVFREALDRVK
jgi:putative addiction module component (TIGR02574 family)